MKQKQTQNSKANLWSPKGIGMGEGYIRRYTQYIVAGVVTKCIFVCLCCTARPNKSKHGSVEQRKVYCRAKQGEWVACVQKPGTLPWVSAKHL